MKSRNIWTISYLLLLFAVPAMADSISPASFSATLNVGESVTVTKTVTVSEEPGVSAPVDVFFLADSTGSMGGIIGAVKTSMSDILADTSGLGDVYYGVGEYRDWSPPDYASSSFAYRLDQAMTNSTAAVTNAINGLAAGEGYDYPESQLYALDTVATSAATGWRTGSTRILVWFGDATGHDPAAFGVTEAQATASLQAANIEVEALNVGYGGLDEDGQATRITAATGGTLYSGIDSDSVGDTIKDAITTAIDTYGTVGLDLSEAPAGVSVSAAPGSYTGSFDRSVERKFGFNVTFTGDAIGDYSFNIYGTVDGGRVATEADSISVVPVPGAVLLGMLGLSVAGLRLRKRA